MSFNVLIVYNPSSKNNLTPDINKIKNSLENFKINTNLSIIDEHFQEVLEKSSPSIIFNLIPLLNNRFSWFLPAICEHLNIPYIGSGIFTISTLKDNFFEDILKYHNIKYSKNAKNNLYHVSILGNKEELIINILNFDISSKTLKKTTLAAEIIEKISSISIILKKALKINDYLSFYLSFDPTQNGDITVNKIEPSPSLGENSHFCISLKRLGISYEEIIIGILVCAMERYNIPIPKNVEQLKNQIFKKIG
ncbi:MAG: hypothetical protein ACFFCM_14590 [Promethearchaeota archaeon]